MCSAVVSYWTEKNINHIRKHLVIKELNKYSYTIYIAITFVHINKI